MTYVVSGLSSLQQIPDWFTRLIEKAKQRGGKTEYRPWALPAIHAAEELEPEAALVYLKTRKRRQWLRKVLSLNQKRIRAYGIPGLDNATVVTMSLSKRARKKLAARLRAAMAEKQRQGGTLKQGALLELEFAP